jgi:hypothetical protein
MRLSRLELVSSYGDQTLSGVRYVLRGTAGATEALTLHEAGLRFTEGQPCVSTNIIQAAKRAGAWGGGQRVGEPGNVILCAVPSNYYVGYGVLTSAYVDRQLKRVGGAPLRYASARDQLALYASAETDEARVRVEAQVANGYPLEQHPEYVLDPRQFVGSFASSSGFESLISQLDVAIHSLQPISLDKFERSLREVMRISEAGSSDAAEAAVRAIVLGTVESSVMSKLRMMRWQGLELLGYSFVEGRNEIQIPVVGDMSEHRHRMDEMSKLLETTTLFSGQLEWLKTYISHVLGMMRVELDATSNEPTD